VLWLRGSGITAGGIAQSTLSGGAFLSLLNGAGPLDPVALQLTTGGSAPSGNLGIKFEVGGVAEVLGAGLLLDNVRMDVTPVPEPSNAGFAILGGFPLLFSRGFSRRRNAS
jgi:hypothetical protein